MNKSIPILTPLRGIAAICVAFFHARLVIFPQWKDTLIEYTHFLENSYLWVDLFFILSGFVIMHVYQNTFFKGINFYNWSKFMGLRFSRIYPLFLATLLVLVAWETFKYIANIGFYGGALFDGWRMSGIPAFQGPFNRGDALIPNIMMLQGVLEKDLSWNISSWSLSVEWLSYMVFPFLVPVLMQKKVSLAIPVLFIISLVAINSHHGSLDITGGVLAYLRALSSFALGTWMCTITLSEKTKERINSDMLLLVIFLMCIYALHLPALPFNDVFIIMVFALLVFISAQQQQRNTVIFKLFDNKVTQFLGDISYSLYLWHAVILLVGIEIINLLLPQQLVLWHLQTRWISAIVGGFFYMAVVLVISTFSYYYLEKPAMRGLRQFFQRSKMITQ